MTHWDMTLVTFSCRKPGVESVIAYAFQTPSRDNELHDNNHIEDVAQNIIRKLEDAFHLGD